MKPRDFLNFFKTKTGKFVAFIALFAIALIIFSALHKHNPSAEDAVSVTGSHFAISASPASSIRPFYTTHTEMTCLSPPDSTWARSATPLH